MHLATMVSSWQSIHDGRGYAQQDDLNPGSCVTFNQPARAQQMIIIFSENGNASWTQRLTQSHGPAVGALLPRKADRFCPSHFIDYSGSVTAAAAQNYWWWAMNVRWLSLGVLSLWVRTLKLSLCLQRLSANLPGETCCLTHTCPINSFKASQPFEANGRNSMISVMNWKFHLMMY